MIITHCHLINLIETFLFVVKELSQLGTYGGNDSIVAFARNNGVNVNIHQLNEPRWVISGSQYSRTGRVLELHLSYHNGDHYSSVRSVNDTDDGPAWPYHNQYSSETKVGIKYVIFSKINKLLTEILPTNSSGQVRCHFKCNYDRFNTFSKVQKPLLLKYMYVIVCVWMIDQLYYLSKIALCFQRF